MHTQHNQEISRWTLWKSIPSRGPMLIKRPITIIELLIAMVLTSLDLSALFYFYRDIDWLNNEMEKSQKNTFEYSYIQTLLDE